MAVTIFENPILNFSFEFHRAHWGFDEIRISKQGGIL